MIGRLKTAMQNWLNPPAPVIAPAWTPPPPAERRIWIDVGAHLGEKTFGPASADPTLTVYAFEPIWGLVARRLGQLANYIAIPAAVAELPGTATFHLNKFAAASSLLPFDPAGLRTWDGGDELQSVRPITVPVVRLDRMLEIFAIDEVEFLKIDAQGADLSVLKSLGDRLAHVRSVNLEVQITPTQLYVGAPEKQAVIDFLTSHGFALTGTEVQSRGQEENLTFENRRFAGPRPTPPIDPLLVKIPTRHRLRPLAPYPGWTFATGFDDQVPEIQERRLMWSRFRDGKTFRPVVLDYFDGLTIEVFMGDDFSRTLFVNGCYEPNEFWFLNEVLQPGMTVIDAGANVGLYAIFCGQRVGATGAVWAFEPSPREFGRLVGNIRRNGLAQVKPVPMALADQDGVAELKIADTEHSGQSTLGGFAHKVDLAGTEAVAVTTLDGFCSSVGIGKIDVIKMDVEGAELALMRGGRAVISRDKPVILFEANDRALELQGASAAAVVAELRGLGYELFAIAADGLFRPAGDALSENMVAAHPTNMPAALAARR